MNLPTPETYDELQRAYDFFNEKLFSNELPPCLITLQREKRTYGYCSFKRFVGRESGYRVDEIAMNPVYFSIRTIKATLSTLVHEMVHQWQFHFGEPGRRGYHNKQWAARMERVGLMPSDTGEPGGRKVGQSMTHYIRQKKREMEVWCQPKKECRDRFYLYVDKHAKEVRLTFIQD